MVGEKSGLFVSLVVVWKDVVGVEWEDSKVGDIVKDLVGCWWVGGFVGCWFGVVVDGVDVVDDYDIKLVEC